MNCSEFLIRPFTDRKFDFPFLVYSLEDLSRVIYLIVGDKEGPSYNQRVLSWYSGASSGDKFLSDRFTIICK